MENKQHNVIPLLRVFDISKAKEFYINWLEFTMDREHRFEENLPLYIQISKDNICLHLTEHHSDCCPVAKVHIELEGGPTAYHSLLKAKDYMCMKSGQEKAPWDGLTMEVIDPFGNKLFFART